MSPTSMKHIDVAIVLAALCVACAAEGDCVAPHANSGSGVDSMAADVAILVVVSTPLGDVKGLRRTSDIIEAFLGMPYVEPPVGALRFVPAQPGLPWATARQTA